MSQLCFYIKPKRLPWQPLCVGAVGMVGVTSPQMGDDRSGVEGAYWEATAPTLVGGGGGGGEGLQDEMARCVCLGA